MHPSSSTYLPSICVDQERCSAIAWATEESMKGSVVRPGRMKSRNGAVDDAPFFTISEHIRKS